ncbi:MAG: hypothetical protein KAI47_07740, partial [Deltaproteobacteria bacterium]|nr:hypothetical protein [Deltaproteobacteria bacterium]
MGSSSWRRLLVTVAVLLFLPACGDSSPLFDTSSHADTKLDGSQGEGSTLHDARVIRDTTFDALSQDAMSQDATPQDALRPDGPRDGAPPDGAALPDGESDALSGDGATSGTLTILSYNVAGLPFGLSQSDPVTNTPLISPLLNAYDLALMQEDFAFTAQLSSKALHPHKSTPGTPVPGTFMNDGLTRFSNAFFTGHTRIKWTACNGVFDQANDCLASKGFSVAETILGPGVLVDVYNLHMDAGNSAGDIAARSAEVDQLVAYIALHSAGRAIILAGDTNLNPSKSVENQKILDKLITQGKLTDACVHLTCGQTDRIDRIMYRSAPTVK